ncbi:MAG: hypothetical protein FJW23_09545 [Acidimicrobiia bacterium]|nr:hypothetical protein [Acidimicrobiia bacterium]
MLDSAAVAYTIKRYSNRKMYDPQTSRYVALDDIRQLIRDGAEVRVEDAATGEDLTSLTLTQILLETERSHQTAVPSALLHQLIKNGEAWYGFLDRVLRTIPMGRIPATPQDVARLWTDWMTQAGAAPPRPDPQHAAEAGDDVADVERELTTLKERLLSLEQRLAREQDRGGTRRRQDPGSRKRR